MPRNRFMLAQHLINRFRCSFSHQSCDRLTVVNTKYLRGLHFNFSIQRKASRDNFHGGHGDELCL